MKYWKEHIKTDVHLKNSGQEVPEKVNDEKRQAMLERHRETVECDICGQLRSKYTMARHQQNPICKRRAKHHKEHHIKHQEDR